MATVQKTLTPAAWLGLMAMGLFWGGSFASIDLMLRDLPFESLVALRVGGGALFLWGYVLLFRLPLPKNIGTWIAFLLIGFLNVVMPFSLISWGQQFIPSSLSSILNASTALFGPIVAAIIFADERLRGRKALGVACGFLGVVTVIGFEALQSFDLTSAGQLALLAASTCYATGTAMMRIFLTDVRPEVGAAGMMGGAAFWMIPFALIQNGVPDFASFQTTTFAAWAYVSIVSSGLAYLILFRVVAMAGSGNATLVTLFAVPVAITLGAVLLGENLPLRAFVGFAIIATGLSIIDGRIWKLAGRKLGLNRSL